MVVEIKTPEPGQVNAWRMLGYLESKLEHKGRISKSDWNEAVEACKETIIESLGIKFD